MFPQCCTTTQWTKSCKKSLTTKSCLKLVMWAFFGNSSIFMVWAKFGNVSKIWLLEKCEHFLAKWAVFSKMSKFWQYEQFLVKWAVFRNVSNFSPKVALFVFVGIWQYDLDLTTGSFWGKNKNFNETTIMIFKPCELILEDVRRWR